MYLKLMYNEGNGIYNAHTQIITNEEAKRQTTHTVFEESNGVIFGTNRTTEIVLIPLPVVDKILDTVGISRQLPVLLGLDSGLDREIEGRLKNA